MREAMQRLNARRFQTDGRDVTYVRAGQSIPVTAFTGRVTVITRDHGDGTFVARSREYFVEPAALDFGAGRTLPQVHDRIIDPDPGDGGTFDLMPLEGESFWRWTDEHKILYRLHALEVG
jgi:hypothetical protein